MNLKQPASLYSTILHNYTYEQIRDLCFTEGSEFPLVFGCDQKIWRDKAIVDFGVTEEFFDLITVLPGWQRYLQIASYVKLTPLSGVRVYENTGAVEGVYEAVRGYRVAEKRRDTDMVLWFAHRIKPEVKDKVDNVDLVLRDLAELKGEEEEEEVYFDKEGDDFAYLIKATEEGKINITDNVIHDVFTLPEGFSIARDVPKHYNYEDVDFWQKKGYLLDLPLQELDETLEDFFLQDLLKASFESPDTRLADFFLSIFRNKKEDIKEAARRARFGYRSLLRWGNPEDAYGIALRTVRYKKTYDKLSFQMAEAALLLKETRAAFLVEHMGDVTSLMAILPFCSKKDARRALNTLTEDWGLDYKHLYPLSTLLLKQHYKL